MVAQLLPFMYLANTLVRREESLLYNDQFMAFFCVLGIYFLVCKDMPWVSALMFSVSISIKAGAILFMPTFLGSIMYRHGTTNLTVCIAIIIIMNVLIAGPFILESLGGRTFVMDYWRMGKFLGGDGKGGQANGAHYPWSVYWRFIP